MLNFVKKFLPATSNKRFTCYIKILRNVISYGNYFYLFRVTVGKLLTIYLALILFFTWPSRNIQFTVPKAKTTVME